MSWLSGSSGSVSVTYGRKKPPSNASAGSSGSASLMPSRIIMPQILEDESYETPALVGPGFSHSPLAEVPLNRIDRSFSSDSIAKKRSTDTPYGPNANPRSGKPRNVSPTPSKTGAAAVPFSNMKSTSVARISSKTLTNTLRKGVFEDVNYLKNALACDDFTSAFQGLVIKAPPLKAEAATRFGNWMDELGFKEGYRSEQQVFLLPLEKVDQFKRHFGDFLSSYSVVQVSEFAQPLAAEIDMEGSTKSLAAGFDADAIEIASSVRNEDYLWRQETIGSNVPPPAPVTATANPSHMRLRVNLLHSSFDSEAGSTPTADSTAPPTPSALSPSGSFCDQPEMTKIISGIGDNMNRLEINRTNSSHSLSSLALADTVDNKKDLSGNFGIQAN